MDRLRGPSVVNNLVSKRYLGIPLSYHDPLTRLISIHENVIWLFAIEKVHLSKLSSVDGQPVGQSFWDHSFGMRQTAPILKRSVV